MTLKLKKPAKRAFVILGILILSFLLIYSLPEQKGHLKSRNFTLVYSTSINEGKIRSIAAALERSYKRISDDLGAKPAEGIVVNIYGSRWEYAKATGNWTASGSIEGPAQLHFMEFPFDNDDIKQVVVHEFTHAVVIKKLIDKEPKPFNEKKFEQKFAKFPIWLWESISCYEAGEVHDLGKLAYLEGGNYPGLEELNSRKGNKAYVLGYSLSEFIIKRFGQEKFMDLIVNYGDVPKVLNISDEEFSRQWYSFAKAKYIQHP